MPSLKDGNPSSMHEASDLDPVCRNANLSLNANLATLHLFQPFSSNLRILLKRRLPTVDLRCLGGRTRGPTATPMTTSTTAPSSSSVANPVLMISTRILKNSSRNWNGYFLNSTFSERVIATSFAWVVFGWRFACPQSDRCRVAKPQRNPCLDGTNSDLRW